MSKKVLITGSTGFVGSELYKACYIKGYDVLGLSRNPDPEGIQNHVCLDLVNSHIDDLRSTIDSFNPEIIFHFAADPLVRNWDHKISEANILATHKLLDCCPQNCMFVFASSATVYGKHNRARCTSSNTKPTSVYALTKLYCEDLVRLYYKEYKKISNYRVLRFCAHVGPNSTHGLVHDIVKKLKSDSPILELLGTNPGPKKPFLHIEDSVNAIIESTGPAHDISWRKTSNVGPDDNLSVFDVAQIVMNQIGIQKPIKWLGKKSNWSGDNKFVLLHSYFNGIRKSEQAIRDALNEKV